MANKTWFAYIDHGSSSGVVTPGAFFMPYQDISFTGKVTNSTGYTEATFTLSHSSIYWWCDLGYQHSPCGYNIKEYSWDFDQQFTLLTGWYVLNKHTLFTKDGVLITSWFYPETSSLKLINKNIVYIDWVFYQSGKKIGKPADIKIKVIDDRFYKINNIVYSMHDVALASIDAKTFKRLKYNPLKKTYKNVMYPPQYYQDKKKFYVRTLDVGPGFYKETLEVYNRKTKRREGYIDVEYNGQLSKWF